MAGKLNLFKFGQGGVNLTKDPLHLSDDELMSAQNAEVVLDGTNGGDGSISKRGGLAVLNSSALSGSILGIHNRPLLTTYTRTLYAAKGTAASNTFMTSSDGASWSNTTSPLAPVSPAKYTNENDIRSARRFASFKNFIIYPGNNYTSGVDNPEIDIWDSTTASLVARIPVGPSSNGSPAYDITDILTTNEGKVYIAVHDPGGTGANIAGRVLQYDLVTGKLSQVLNAFGPGTTEVSGGCPSALVWYQNQLFVGLNGSATTNGIGKVVRGYPNVSTTWTTDVSNLVSHISTMAVFLGDLYVGTQSSASTGAKIYKRASSTGAWTTQVTSGSGAAGNGHYASLYVSGSILYAVEYFQSTDVLTIVKSSDGTTWSTSRDVKANDSPASPPQFPGEAIEYGGSLYYVFRATTATATDGFVMQLTSGTWTKVATDNFGGPLAILVARA